jgi:glycosyltransferase involved in cell wall biosynthesis
MKICYVVPWFPSLQASNIEARQAIFGYRQTMKHSQRGHEFKIISLRWKGQCEHEVINDRVEVHRLPYIFKFADIRYPVPNLLTLTRKIKYLCQSWHADLLIYSHINFLTVLPIFYLKPRLKVPSVVTTDSFPGISWFYGNKAVDTIGYLYSMLISKRVLRLADGIQLMSSPLAEYAAKLGIDESRVFTIPRGVDTDLFQPGAGDKRLKDKLGIKEDDRVILNVGRLDRVKGVDYLILAAKRVLSSHDRADRIKFLIVGGGSLRKRYEKLARPFSENIVFLGFRNDVPQLMNIAHLFVLPSLSEGAANVAMEASASGLPVVATAVGEVPQIVADGETGLLVSPKDIDGLAEKIAAIIDNPSLGRKMGEAGRRRMEQKYSLEIICQRLEEAYQGVIERASSQAYNA